MSITRSIRTPIMHRAVEANGFVFLGGTIADDTSVSMGDQTRNILGKIAAALGEPVPVETVAPMLMITSRVPHFIDPVVILRGRKLSFKQFSNLSLIHI